MSRLHVENHLVSRIGWLRAAVLGANDGIVSTASLIVGVASDRRAEFAGSGRRHSRAGGGRHVDGGRRVCLGQLPVGHREYRPRPRTRGTASSPADNSAKKLSGSRIRDEDFRLARSSCGGSDDACHAP
jgi:hypothetical protein